MLKEKQGRASVRTLGLEDLQVATSKADRLLEYMGLSLARRHGMRLTVEQGTPAISSTWPGKMTAANLVFDSRKKDWRLASVSRTSNNGKYLRWRLAGYPTDLHKVLEARWR